MAFRSLNPLPGTLESIPISVGYAFQTPSYTVYNGVVYTAKTVGFFDGSRLAASFGDALNWLPENTYTPSPLTLRYNAQGQPVAPSRSCRPPIRPASPSSRPRR